jgi:hypothetical protein
MSEVNDEIKLLLAEVERLDGELKMWREHFNIRRLREKLAGRELALEQIARKRPHDVSREEAADMACEFVLIARAALKGEP